MNRKRKILLISWLVFVLLALLLFVFNQILFKSILVYLLSKSAWAPYVGLFVLGCLRGFTLIPVTVLIVVGLAFLPAWPLFLIIMSGVGVSSISVYYFFEYLKIESMVNRKHKALIEKGSRYLNKYELPVILLWSMAPFLPTDVICYLAGTLRINVYKFILGVLIGEGIVCAVYIFGGKLVLNYLSLA